MKTKRSAFTLSEELRQAINKDLEEAYAEACFGTYNHHGTLCTLQQLGVDAMPHTDAVLKRLHRMENCSVTRLHDIWGLKRPFGLSNLQNN